MRYETLIYNVCLLDIWLQMQPPPKHIHNIGATSTSLVSANDFWSSTCPIKLPAFFDIIDMSQTLFANWNVPRDIKSINPITTTKEKTQNYFHNFTCHIDTQLVPRAGRSLILGCCSRELTMSSKILNAIVWIPTPSEGLRVDQNISSSPLQRTLYLNQWMMILWVPKSIPSFWISSQRVPIWSCSFQS